MARLLRFLIAILLAALPASGAVIYSGVRNIDIATSYDGTWLDFRNGAAATDYSGSPAAFDVNFFVGGAGIWTSDKMQPVTDTGAINSTVRNLAPGVEVDGTSTFPASFSGSLAHMGPGPDQWASGGVPTTGYIGMRIQPTSWVANSPGMVVYGWIQVTLRDDGNIGTVIDWAWEDSGAALQVGQIPEPNAAALFACLLLLGLLSRRR